MYLVRKIIEKCEHSSRDWREGATGGRSLRITQEDYDACGKQALIDEAQTLENAGFLTIKKWVTMGSDIDTIAYRVEKLPQFYLLLDGEDGKGVQSKQERVNHYMRKIEAELSEGFQKEWIEQYYESVRARLDKGEFPKEVEKLDAYLACFRGIDNLEEPVIKRIFSKQHLKDSKMFERHLERHIVTVARKYCPEITEDMDSRTVLEQLMIEEYSQELAVKGPLKLKIWRGAEAKRVDLSDFLFGTVLNSQTLKHAVVELDQPGLKKVVTIENKANYISMPFEPDTLYVFSHGYFSPLDREFLKKVRRALSGKQVEYYHSGDLDFGGVKIYEYIQKQIFPEVKPLKMDVATFEKYQDYAENIGKETLEKLKQTQIPDLDDLIQKMIDTGKGIEQESFLIV